MMRVLRFLGLDETQHFHCNPWMEIAPADGGADLFTLAILELLMELDLTPPNILKIWAVKGGRAHAGAKSRNLNLAPERKK